MSQFTFQENKFKQLLLYIAKSCKNDTFFGATKLNKQLFFLDFLAYTTLGTPITGADYMAIERGPVPRRLLPIREEMIEDDQLTLERRGYQERIVALVEPDLQVFTKDELTIIDRVIEALRETDAEEVSGLSYKFLGWQAAHVETLVSGHNTSIPYGTVWVGKVPDNRIGLQVLGADRMVHPADAPLR